MQAWYGDTGLLFYNNQDTLNPFLTVRTADSTGLFFDDQWSISQAPDAQSRAAVRSHDDEVRRRARSTSSSTSPEDINGPPPVLRDRASTDNIFDFKTWGPRLGLTYMLTEDGKTVARASYGRYYQPLSVETPATVRSRHAARGTDARRSSRSGRGARSIPTATGRSIRSRRATRRGGSTD